ncbi:MAG: nucleotidyltransferase family protein [bacterium]|nr:nucleotidyltransferase family protein [bacterium]
MEKRFLSGAREAARYFVEKSNVHLALERLVDRLTELDIPYAIVGALSLNAYGYQRTTSDVDVLVRREGLEAFKKEHLGRGYLEKFPGSKGLRDATQNIEIDVLLTGDYPGDGKRKPIAFPDPAEVAERGERFALLPLPRLLELKLASGMTAPHRLRDLADVLELVRINELGEELAGSLHPYVREKYRELWQAAQVEGEEE